MRGKLTWRVRRWSEGALVEDVPAFRARYGDELADVVELVRDVASSTRDEPTSQDVRRTLEAVAAGRSDVDLTRLDSESDMRLATMAWRMYRRQRLEDLTPEEVAASARAALAEFRPRPGGRPGTDWLALRLVRDLMAILPRNVAPRARDAMLHDALVACHLGATPENVRRLLAKAGRFSN